MSEASSHASQSVAALEPMMQPQQQQTQQRIQPASSSASDTEPTRPCNTGLQNGVIYFEHPHAPAFDPRLHSTPERMNAIKSKVPALDFTKLRGGHRKPSAPVALAALANLKQATAGGMPPKQPKPPKQLFKQQMASPPPPAIPTTPKPATNPHAASTHTPWGTRKPVGTTSATEMLRQLEAAEALAETPASAGWHMGAAAKRPPPSSQKPASAGGGKRPPRPTTGGIDFLSRLEKIERAERDDKAVGALSHVQPAPHGVPTATTLPEADPLGAAMSASPIPPVAICAAATVTPRKAAVETSATCAASPATASSAGYSSNSDDHYSSGASSIASEEVACTGGANAPQSRPSPGKVHRTVAGIEQGGGTRPRTAPIMNNVSPSRSTLLAGGSAFESRISKAALVSASQTLAARPRQKPSPRQARSTASTPMKPPRGNSPVRAGSPARNGSPRRGASPMRRDSAAVSGALGRSLAVSNAARAQRGTPAL